MLIVYVHAHVKPESVADFRQATIENARSSVQEPGIARFDVVQQQDDTTRFVLIEVYRTPEAAAAHKETAHYRMARCGRSHDGRAASQREIQRCLPRSPGLVEPCNSSSRPQRALSLAKAQQPQSLSWRALSASVRWW